MERRDLLRAFGAATALTFLPGEALASWARVATTGGQRLANGLSDAQIALVRAIADAIIPRTDTPSAIDVGVHGFVDVIVAERMTETSRAAFLAGLDAIDARSVASSGVVFADLTAEAQGAALGEIESSDRNTEPARTYWRLKGLIVHGYFTSEPVMKNVLHHQVLPGKFEGAAPHA
jgi:hypothetical protein